MQGAVGDNGLGRRTGHPASPGLGSPVENGGRRVWRGSPSSARLSNTSPQAVPPLPFISNFHPPAG